MTDPEKLVNDPSAASRLVAGIMLLITPLFGWPYGYYQLLRLVVTAVCGWHTVLCYQQSRVGWMCLMGISTLLFNPIFTVHLTRAQWMPVDLVLGTLLLASLQLLRWRGTTDDGA